MCGSCLVDILCALPPAAQCEPLVTARPSRGTAGRLNGSDKVVLRGQIGFDEQFDLGHVHTTALGGTDVNQIDSFAFSGPESRKCDRFATKMAGPPDRP